MPSFGRTPLKIELTYLDLSEVPHCSFYWDRQISLIGKAHGIFRPVSGTYWSCLNHYYLFLLRILHKLF